MSEDEKKKVIILTDITQPGGVDDYTISLCKTAVLSGYLVRVIIESASGANRLADMLLSESITFFREKISHNNNEIAGIEKIINKHIDEFKPDIAHVICGSTRSAIEIRKVYIDRKIPLFSSETCFNASKQITGGRLRELKVIYRKSRGIVLPYQKNIADLYDRYGVKISHPVIISNSIEMNGIISKPDYELHKPLKILGIGRLESEKGYDILISSMKSCRFEYTLDIYGTGGRERELLEIISCRGLEERICLMGWAYESKKLYKDYDLFIMPSRFEGQPLILIEALASGIPCIASDLPGISALTKGETYAYLVSKRQGYNYGFQVNRFLANPGRLQNKALKAGKEVKKQYDMNNSMKKIIKLWEEAGENEVDEN